MNIIPQSEVLDLLNSQEEFPVDFDRAMEWWQAVTRNGQPVRRDNLIRKFVGCGDYVEGMDYQLLKFEELRPQGGFSPKVSLSMTVDCFKLFGMTIAGKRGREIRLHFLKCEKSLKEILSKSPSPSERDPQQVEPMAPPQPPCVMPTPQHIQFMRQPGAMNDPDWMTKGNWDKAFAANQEYDAALLQWKQKVEASHKLINPSPST